MEEFDKIDILFMEGEVEFSEEEFNENKEFLVDKCNEQGIIYDMYKYQDEDDNLVIKIMI